MMVERMYLNVDLTYVFPVPIWRQIMKTGVVKDPVSSQKLMVLRGPCIETMAFRPDCKRAVVHSRACSRDGGSLVEFQGRCPGYERKYVTDDPGC